MGKRLTASVFIGVALAGCGRVGPAVPAASELSLQEALAKVHQFLPASRYVTNDLLPASDNTAPAPAGPPLKLRVGLPWVLNDEIAPWFVGIEQGYFRDVGLELELVPGGPGIDPLQLLAGGKLDIAVPPAGAQVVQLIASPTPADIVAIGAVLKGSPYCWLGIDATTPRDQASKKQLEPHDFIGTTVGLQPGSDPLFDFLVHEYHLPRDSIRVRRAGFTPEPLLTGAVDYYGAFVVNQPRILEQAGHRNWVAFRFAKWGWVDFADVSVVRRDAFEPRKEVWRRYLLATGRALRFILDHPDKAAQITARRSTDVPLTPAMVRRRFDLQRELMEGAPGSALQRMPLDDWEKLTAHLLQSHALTLPGAPPPPASPVGTAQSASAAHPPLPPS
jgi:ABC-type nitrate/sulfonate/bicarbonate transport system substrate-binding protein